MFDNAIFDMDGVLIESEQFYCERRFKFLEQNNFTPKSLTVQDYIGLTDENIWEKLIPNDDTQRKYLKNQYNIYKRTHPIDFEKVLRKEVPFVLESLFSKGKKIGLASSSPREEIDGMLKQCNLTPFFTFVISGDEVVSSKPAPDIYLKSMSVLGGNSLVIEDSPTGIEAAKKANLFTLALKQGFCCKVLNKE